MEVPVRVDRVPGVVELEGARGARILEQVRRVEVREVELGARPSGVQRDRRT